MTLQRMEHQGAAPTTGVGSNFSGSATTFTLVSGTGFPTGAVGPFVLKIDAGTTSEEKILCSSRSGTTVTVSSSPAGRGFDGTTATSHSAGTTNVEHCYTAVEADDDNDHVYTTSRDDHTQYLRADGSRTGATAGVQTFSDGVAVTTGGLTVGGGLTVNGKAFYDANNIPVGGLVASYSGPSGDVSATNTTQTVDTFTAALISGEKYLLTVYGVAMVTAGTPTFVNVTVTDSGSLITGADFIVSQNAPPTTSSIPGCLSKVLSPGSTGTVTFTLHIQDSGAATTSKVPAGDIQASIVRIA